ncbi:MAG TPA: type II toxin-antitoxin system PemK/MazF family toxin [Hyphomicrobiaceae bacterium]|nr:type II toxin-antitoxin system PemK/MazF family toxin [Hyphomicrobiaceae bacterium]
MRRGDIVVVSAPGEYGKPRPVVVVQTDLLNEAHTSVAVCLMTTDVIAAPLFRLTVEPSEGNGLRKRSQIMVDKIVALRRERLGQVAGTLDDETMLRLNRTLAFVLGLGD